MVRKIISSRRSSRSHSRSAPTHPSRGWAAKEADRRLEAAEAGKDIPYDNVVSRVYGSQDFREGVDAYLEKRKPEWTGR